MATQVNNGAGFEYACASALLQQYRNNDRQLFIDQQTIPGFKLRERRFDDVKPDIKEQMTKAAKAVAHHLTTSNESWAKNMFKPSCLYRMRVGDDARNMDVRDLVIYNDRGDQLGVSLKWNSSEIKSLRLGNNWFRQFHIPDLGQWKAAVSEHHRMLSRYEFWRDAIADLGLDGVYGVYRNAVIAQIKRGEGKQFIDSLCQFLFGKQDYLKVMAIAKGKDISLAYYDSKNLPTKIHHIGPSSRGEQYLEVIFDKGWQLLFRLHNKDSAINPDSVGSGMSLTTTVTGWGEKSGQRCWRVADEY